jgi:hypothetical protein
MDEAQRTREHIWLHKSQVLLTNCLVTISVLAVVANLENLDALDACYNCNL